jgi:predicted phosphodiesterase
VVIAAFALHQAGERYAWPDLSLRQTAEAVVLDPGAGPWKVAIIGDPQGGDAIYAAGLRDMTERRPDAVIFLGDMVTAPSAAKFAQFIARVRQVPGHPRIFCLPGNHDEDRRTGLANYERFFGRPYYSVRLGSSLFLLLNNSTEQLDHAQRRWLVGQLEAAAAGRLDVFLCMHVPPRGCGVKKDQLDLESSRFLELAIRTHPVVRMIFAGHLHAYAEGSFAGVPVYVSGGGGGRLDSPKEEHHYLLMESAAPELPKVSRVRIAPPSAAVMKKERFLYYLETRPDYVYWLAVAAGGAPLAWALWRRRRARPGRAA